MTRNSAPDLPNLECPPAGPSRPLASVARAAPGVAAAVALGAAATALGGLWPVVGAPVIAVLGGTLLSPLIGRARPRDVLGPGLDFAKGRVLQFSVVLLGAQLSLGEVASVGLSSLPVMLGTLVLCLGTAWLLSRRMRIPRDLATLVGVGTGICGASAIAAVSSTIKAKSADIAYAVSTIFLFNVAAVVVFPPLGHALGLSQTQFGLFAGTAVNDTSSVVATAATYGSQASQHAVVVKLVRTLMIIPIVLALGAMAQRRNMDSPSTNRVSQAVRLVPWFLIAFVVVVASNSAGAVPHVVQAPLKELAMLCIAIALAAIGMSTDLKALRHTGGRPLLLGLLLWTVVTVSSLGLQALFA